MRKKLSIILLVAAIFLNMGAVQFALADDFTGKLEPPIKHETFEDLIAAIIKFIFNVALIVAPIIIIIGAFYFVAAAGDPSKIETGKKIIFYTLIGFIIILLSRGLVKLLMEEVIEVK